MKKVIMIIITIVAMLGIILGIYYILNNRIDSYTEITYDEYTKYVENKEDFILYIGSEYCTYCQEFEPIIKKFVKDYQVEIKFIDVADLEQKQYSILKNKTKISGTPTIVIFKDGVVKSGADNKIQGASTYNELEAFFKKQGYIK